MDASEIKAQLNDRLEELLSNYYPGWKRDGQYARPLPGKGGDMGSMWVNLTGHKRGAWCRGSTGDKGDEISLISYAIKGDTKCDSSVFQECLKFIGKEPTRPVARAEKKKTPESKGADLAKIISETTLIDGTVAEKYLKETRGIDGIEEWPQCLRFHPNLFYEKNVFYPALIAMVVDRNKNPTGWFQIFLDENGKKAPVKTVKKARGKVGGGCIMLSDATDWICVTEGLENALSVMQLFNKPCWALGSTSNSDWSPPDNIRTVRIYPDGDIWKRRNGKMIEPPGKKFAESLRENLMKKSISAIVQPAPNAKDWNDLLLQMKNSYGKTT